MRSTAQITVTDIDPVSVANIAAGDLGSHPRATVRRIDATDIDAARSLPRPCVVRPSFHHLRPVQAARVLERGHPGGRQARGVRPVPPARPGARDCGWRRCCPSRSLPFAHDGLISSLRAYSPSAFQALAAHADPAINLDFSRLGVTRSSWRRGCREGGRDAGGTGPRRLGRHRPGRVLPPARLRPEAVPGAISRTR